MPVRKLKPTCLLSVKYHVSVSRLKTDHSYFITFAFMNFREYQPCVSLKPFIEAYWTFQTGGSGQPAGRRVIPDGCTDLICNMGNALKTPDNDTLIGTDQVTLLGTMSRFFTIVAQPDSFLFGIRFRPSAFTLFYNIPMYDFANTHVEFDRPLLDLIHPFNDSTIARVDSYLLNKIDVHRHYLLPVVNDLIRQNGRVHIDKLAENNCCGKRQLERNFMMHVGVSAKELSNIYRYKTAFKQLKSGGPSVSLRDIAFENGYYDQAHLANEFKKYSGYTPSQI